MCRANITSAWLCAWADADAEVDAAVDDEAAFSVPVLQAPRASTAATAAAAATAVLVVVIKDSLIRLRAPAMPGTPVL